MLTVGIRLERAATLTGLTILSYLVVLVLCYLLVIWLNEIVIGRGRLLRVKSRSWTRE